jgi:hypothetical protein
MAPEGMAMTQLNQMFFGTVDHPGHYFWGPDGRMLRGWSGTPLGLPWGSIDGRLTPVSDTTQGAALLHVLDGWSALSIHDYSVDKRPGSNSTFFISEEYHELEHFLRRFGEWPEDSFFAKRLAQIGPIHLAEK